jgi:Sec7-like guanine-nucleotide exchange factor
MDGSVRLAETLEELFAEADASDFLTPFKEVTGASEVSTVHNHHTVAPLNASSAAILRSTMCWTQLTEKLTSG